MQSRLWKLAGSAAAAIIVACSADSGTLQPPPTQPAQVVVTLTSAQLTVGQSTQARASVRAASGTEMSGVSVTWTSSNSAVATVDASGTVSTIGVGSTTIAATASGVSGTAALAVQAPPPTPVTGVAVSLLSSTIGVGGGTQATAVVSGQTGVLQGRVVTWSSSNAAVANVNASSGIVTGVGAGSSTISATSEGITGTAIISVTATTVPVASVSIALGASSLVPGGTTQATATTWDASAGVLPGRVVTFASSNTAIATVNSSTGVVTAVAAGSTNITATSEGKTGTTTLTVTAAVIPVATVTVSLAATSVVAGASTGATAVTRDAGGTVLTGRAVAWSSSNVAIATINATTGAITGVAAGTATITATSEGKTGGATLTVTAPPPVATQLAITTQPASSVQSGAALSATIQLRSASNANVAQSGVVVTASRASGAGTLGGTLTATTNASGAATFSNLTITGSGAHTLQFSAAGLAAATSAAITVSSSSTATILFQETFEDANLAARGWYGTNGVPLSTVEHIPGSTRSLEWTFNSGQMYPNNGGSGRHLFTDTDELFVSYWVKYSSNWVGSNQSAHPHEFYVITNEDNANVGPAWNHLTVYIEENFVGGLGGTVFAFQDGANIDATRVNQDLTNVTENRATAGCNGSWDGGQAACYQSGSVWVNARAWRSGNVFTAANKNAWHKIESYYKLNTISGGKGQANGIVQTWVDGQQVQNLTNIMFRTAAHPNMKFNQFVVGPYIGNGSPVTQTMWIDDLIVMNGKPF
jgi:uncharacterized protein YjdB